MTQNTIHKFSEKHIDWKRIQEIGISKQQLEESGNLELLLQGKETGIVSLEIHTPVLCMTMDATLRLIEDKDGQVILEVNGINPEF